MRNAASAFFAAMAGVVITTAAAAHQPPPLATRELVRVQGHPGATADATKRQLKLVALGVEQGFDVTDYRVFRFSEGSPESAMPVRLTLNGSRELLSRLNRAAPDHLVTILAERRPGASDLFLLTLDVCPAD